MLTKECNVCHETLLLTDFPFENKSLNKRHNRCRECNKIMSKAHYQSNKDAYRKRKSIREQSILDVIAKAKDAPCTDCGITYPTYVMDFDHLKNKEFNISIARNKGVSLARLSNEI